MSAKSKRPSILELFLVFVGLIFLSHEFLPQSKVTASDPWFSVSMALFHIGFAVILWIGRTRED
jgi:hypothetical protein